MRFGKRLVVSISAAAIIAAGLAPTCAPAEDLDSARSSLDAYGQSLSDYQTALSTSSEDLEGIKGQISQKQQEIDETQARYDEVRGRLSERMRASYMDGNTTMLDVILSSDSFEQFVSNVYYLSKVNQSDMSTLEQTKALSDQLYAEKCELDAREAAAEQAVADAQRVADEYSSKLAEVQSYYNSLPEDVKQAIADEVQSRAASEGIQTTSQGVVADTLLNAVSSVAQANYRQAESTGDYSKIQGDAAISTTAGAASAGGGDASAVAGSGAGQPSGGSASGSGGSTGSRGGSSGGSWLERANSYLGTPYVYGGSSISGTDCSGFVNLVYGGSRGRTTYDMMSSAQSDGTWHTDFDNMQPGDVIITSGGNHVGIYAGDGKMYNATKPGEDVRLSDLTYFDKVGYIPGSQY
jgi:cell wall-associated NlpC family hydrolase